ncbi:hypothetical protein B0H15DRAFT_473799 [Mycena belliarum]|uniref:Uncharacterized protein n=1 Tax=Mycena belliarum TaxID=1033014 RepID=A0AAD6XIJ8_9AGAR|nr:hypothetical protein B0H15DRAFT_473799 [Mycena belliae]
MYEKGKGRRQAALRWRRAALHALSLRGRRAGQPVYDCGADPANLRARTWLVAGALPYRRTPVTSVADAGRARRWRRDEREGRGGRPAASVPHADNALARASRVCLIHRLPARRGSRGTPSVEGRTRETNRRARCASNVDHAPPRPSPVHAASLVVFVGCVSNPARPRITYRQSSPRLCPASPQATQASQVQVEARPSASAHFARRRSRLRRRRRCRLHLRSLCTRTGPPCWRPSPTPFLLPYRASPPPASSPSPSAHGRRRRRRLPACTHPPSVSPAFAPRAPSPPSPSLAAPLFAATLMPWAGRGRCWAAWRKTLGEERSEGEEGGGSWTAMGEAQCVVNAGVPPSLLLSSTVSL